MSISPHAAKTARLVAVVSAGMVVCNLAFYVAALLCGLEVHEVRLHYGGCLLRFRRGVTYFCVGWLPIGGFVRYKSLEQNPTSPQGTYEGAHPLVRMILPLLGPLAMLGAALLLISPLHAWQNMVEMPGQLLQLFQSDRMQLGRDFSRFAGSAPWQLFCGVVLVKFATFNFLPLPIANGGMSLIALLECLFGWKPSSRHLKVPQLLSFVGLLGFTGLALYVFGRNWFS